MKNCPTVFATGARWVLETWPKNLLLVFFVVFPVASSAADQVNPHQAAIDDLNDKKALIKAERDLLEAQAALIKNEYPALPDGFGKKGSLTIEASERDKFHVSARAAESFAQVAAQIATAVEKDCEATCVLMTDTDRVALLLYWDEKATLERTARGVESLLGKVKLEAIPEGPLPIVTLGAVLMQAAQLTQIVRTDKSLAFGDAAVPDELLFDYVVFKLKAKVLYPTGTVDGIISGKITSDFRKNLEALLVRRSALVAASADKNKKEKADALIKQVDDFATRLTTVDAATKKPLLLSVLVGEVVDQHLKVASGRSLTLKVLSKGGSSLKTTSIWRSDRLYAAGGIVAMYRVTEGDSAGTIKNVGVAIAETHFKRIPLD